jgi:hypothetical protein
MGRGSRPVGRRNEGFARRSPGDATKPARKADLLRTSRRLGSGLVGAGGGSAHVPRHIAAEATRTARETKGSAAVTVGPPPGKAKRSWRRGPRPIRFPVPDRSRDADAILLNGA